MPHPRWLKTAARRSAEVDWSLGHVFERYQAIEGRSAEELAEELGCSLEVLQWLSLCRRPEGRLFAEHLLAIASRFGVAPPRLAAVLRHTDVVDALAAGHERQEGAHEDSLLLAARERPDGEGTGS